MKFGQTGQKTKIKRHKSTIKRKNQLKKLSEHFKFYDFKNLSPNNEYQFIVEFTYSIDVTTYSDIKYSSNDLDFIYQMKIMKKFINRLFHVLPDSYCMVRKYEKDWVVDRNLAEELSEYLSDHSVKNNFDQLLFLKKDDKAIDLLIDSVFKYNSFIQFIFEDSAIVVSPSDHLDVFISGENLSDLNKTICKCLSIFSEENILKINKVS